MKVTTTSGAVYTFSTDVDGTRRVKRTGPPLRNTSIQAFDDGQWWEVEFMGEKPVVGDGMRLGVYGIPGTIHTSRVESIEDGD